MGTSTVWPKATNPAFTAFVIPDDGGRSTAMVSERPTLYDMAHGFRVAANQLAAKLDRGGSEPDVVFFPFAYLWRHYLELELKALLLVTVEYFREGGVPAKPHHRIVDYWDALLPFVRQLAEYEGNEESLDAVDRVIREVARYDPDSFAFRYPSSSRGAPTMKGLPRVVSLRALHGAMERVATFLESVHAEFWEHVNNRASQSRSYPDEWYDMHGPSRVVK